MLARLQALDPYRRSVAAVFTFVSLLELGLRGEVRHDDLIGILQIYAWGSSFYKMEEKALGEEVEDG